MILYHTGRLLEYWECVYKAKIMKLIIKTAILVKAKKSPVTNALGGFRK